MKVKKPRKRKTDITHHKIPILASRWSLSGFIKQQSSRYHVFCIVASNSSRLLFKFITHIFSALLIWVKPSDSKHLVVETTNSLAVSPCSLSSDSSSCNKCLNNYHNSIKCYSHLTLQIWGSTAQCLHLNKPPNR